MKTKSFFMLFLMLSLVTPSMGCAADDSVFAQAEVLRLAIVQHDMGFLRSLDSSGELITEENMSYLFDSSWIKTVDENKVSVREILSSASVTTLISEHEFRGKRMYYIYWISDQRGDGISLTRDEWLRTIAACALTKSDDGRWAFYRHLCFAETGGPFE